MSDYVDDFEAEDTPRNTETVVQPPPAPTTTVQPPQAQPQQPVVSSSSSTSSSSSGSSSSSSSTAASAPPPPTAASIENPPSTSEPVVVAPQQAQQQQEQQQPSAAENKEDFQQPSSLQTDTIPAAATVTAPAGTSSTEQQTPVVPQGEKTDTAEKEEKSTAAATDAADKNHKCERIGLTCPRCGCIIFGGARLQIASVVLPDCPDCKKLGFAEVFYHPPKIDPENTRGSILKKKNAEALKVTIEEKRQRTLNHAKAQMLAIEEYVSRQRRDKCTKVHKNEQVKTDEEKQQEKENAEKEEAEKKRAEKRRKHEEEVAASGNSGGGASKDSVAGIHFDSTTVCITNIHGASLACDNGDELRKIATEEASRLNMTLPALLAIPGYVDLKGRRLGVKRVGPRYEIGFGFSATPLHFATLACRADLVATLLDMGADPQAAAGPSSIHKAANRSVLAPSCIDVAKANSFSAVLSLLEHSIKESAKSKFGQVCEKKLAAAAERVRQRNKREGATAGFA